MRSLSKAQCKQIAENLAQDIKAASRLGKQSLSARGRAQAYTIKSRKLSTALLHYEEFFSVVNVSRDERHGILLLIRMPGGYGSHLPLSALTDAAEKKVRQCVLALIELSLYPEANTGQTVGFKCAA